jgi:hypothetical protein
MIILPAFGRDYTRCDRLLGDWNKGIEFALKGTGALVKRIDAEELKVKKVVAYYSNLTKEITLIKEDDKEWIVDYEKVKCR